MDLFEWVVQNDLFYSYYSTILIFGLSEAETEILKKCLNNIQVHDKLVHKKTRIKLFEADVVSDIYAIPHFMAFINSACLDDEELETLLQFYMEWIEPLPPELAQLEGMSEDNIKIPTTFILNCGDVPEYSIPGIYFNKDIFNNQEKLRLTILSEVKNIEGKGRKACESSIRLRRVLLMYKCLLQRGVLTKQKADEMFYPDIVSKRMFYRDIQIINEIENNKVIYDRNLKGYVLRG